MRAVAFRAFAIAVVACAALVSATPTKPVVSDAYNLPWTYLANTNGALSVTTTKPAYANLVAKAQWNASLADLGWDYLNIEGDGDYMTGYLEGYLTAERIILAGIPAVPSDPKVLQWVVDHVAYMKATSKALRYEDKFWAKVGDLLSYLDGMADGVNAKNVGTNVTSFELFLINFGDEVGDVQTAVDVQSGKEPKGFNQNWKPSHCSALIKVTHDDLYMAHDTWSGFLGMTYRIYKVTTFKGVTVTFSAHPAFMASGDDWYMTSNQLAVQETTNGVMNTSLFVAVVPRTVSEWLRTMAATYLADNGEMWTTYFSRENSGTYNNQYMVVDFKLYSPGSTVAPNTLWVAEQLPGVVVRGDQSAVLRDNGFWASYNVPFYPEIYALSGYLKDYEIYGNFYSYSKYARPEIFKRNQQNITNLEGMQRMMRYNDYETDPFSKIQNCSGAPNDQCLTPQSSMLSIASRGDLMPLYANKSDMIAHYGPLYTFMAQGCFGAIDSKIAAWSNRHTLRAYVIAGPSNDQQPTFQWNTKSCTGTAAPRDTPATVDYPWVEFNRVRDPIV